MVILGDTVACGPGVAGGCTPCSGVLGSIFLFGFAHCSEEISDFEVLQKFQKNFGSGSLNLLLSTLLAQTVTLQFDNAIGQRKDIALLVLKTASCCELAQDNDWLVKLIITRSLNLE